MTTETNDNSQAMPSTESLLPGAPETKQADAPKQLPRKPRGWDCFPDQMARLRDTLPVPGAEQTLDNTLDRVFLNGGLLVDLAHAVQDIADDPSNPTEIEQAISVLRFARYPYAPGIVKDLDFLIKWLKGHRASVGSHPTTSAVAVKGSNPATTPASADSFGQQS